MISFGNQNTNFQNKQEEIEGETSVNLQMKFLIHEFRNVLHKILLCSELKDDSSFPKIRQISMEGSEIIDILSKDIFNSTVNPTLCDLLNGIVVEKSQTIRKGFTITFNSKNDQEKIFIPFPHVIQLAVNNIINNCEKFSNPSKCNIEYIISDKNIIITIMDYGPGINPSKIKSLLKGKQSSSNGMGKGLYLTNQLLKMIGGTLLIKSRSENYEDGTRFDLIIPK